MQQYPLPLPHHEAMEADDFMITSSNREAAAWIDKWPDWTGHALTIYGPAGSGKTHLAHVWLARSHGKFIEAKHLANADIGALASGNFVIDDAAQIAGNAARERGLLHLYNILRESKGGLLLTSDRPPAQWNIELPDLRSRLLAAPAIALAAPDDELLKGLLLKQFDDRQIKIGADVVDFILPRVTRTPEALRDLVGALDRASLAEGRRITVALAKRILESTAAS